MKVYVYLFACIMAVAAEVQAQNSGNVVYSEANRAEANRRLAKGPVALGAISMPDNSGMIIPAHVQINVKADEYVAVFGLSQEGRTIQECNQKLNAQVEKFTGELSNIGAKVDDLEVDHIINPVVTEPVVQFSLYLQIKYLFDK